MANIPRLTPGGGHLHDVRCQLNSHFAHHPRPNLVWSLEMNGADCPRPMQYMTDSLTLDVF